MLNAHRRLFIGLILFYGIAGALLVGLASQSAYDQLSQLLDDTGSELFTGGWGNLGQAGLLLLSGLSGSLSPQLTDAQQIYSALILLLTWLTAVWLLRAILSGKRPRLRDGLYDAGGPIVGTAIVLLILLVQLLPATLAVIVANSAASTNLFESGLIAMIISLAVALLVVLSAYWAVGTFMALIIVTLPGMYPWRAIRAAGDIVTSRRVRLILRLAWLASGNVLAWIMVVLPAILLERFLSGIIPPIANVPIVPLVIMLVSSVIVVWSAAYVYLLYRKVVEDDAAPA